jgi:intracellular sulfur oxidation DsrE/DsrF family protein
VVLYWKQRSSVRMTTTNIKITELNNIGSNVAFSTIVPVVHMAGIPTTVSANLQIIGNLILSGAGGNFVAASNSIHAVTSNTANYADIADTVSNGAQPNITSTGTLANLVISGSVILPASITVTGSDPFAAVDTSIAFKIPVVIRGVTYYLALTAAV